MTDLDSPPTTVQPYGPGTRWTFSYKENHFEQTEELALYAEPDGSPISDDYLPEEITAAELWRMWVTQYADLYHEKWPALYAPGVVPILWTVTRPTMSGIFEAAPHMVDRPPIPEEYRWMGDTREDFLTHFTHPVHAVTGERLNWLRLPVMDRGWNETASHKGGFIQEATGWKPSPLQPTMNVRQLGAAAGLYVPPLPD